MSVKKINWGIIGLGNIAEKFARDLSLVSNANLYAVASRDENKAKEFAALHSSSKAYGDYDSLIKDSEVDFIYIAVPHNFHAALAIQALNAKKHVLCEKPLAINSYEAKQIIAASKKNNCFFMEAFWTRFNPSFADAYTKIKRGDLGEIRYINADFGFIVSNPRERHTNINLGGGSLLDVGVYPLFLSYMILGKPETIMASAIFSKTGVEQQTTMLLNYSKAQAILQSSFIAKTDMTATISGDKGRIVIAPNWHETQSYAVIENDIRTDFLLPTNGKGFTYEIEECHNCIEKGKIESQRWSHQNSLDLVEIVDQVRKQAGIVYPSDL